MQIKDVVNDTPFEDNSLVYNPSTKLFRTYNSTDFQLLTTKIEHVEPNYKIFTDNLTKEKRASITELWENKNIVLVKHDKRGDG